MNNKQVIRRKYQVFISSTKTDLNEERKMVFEAVSKLGCIAVGMEQFPAGEKSWKLVQKDIDESDIYILITAGRYGTPKKIRNKTLSFTEHEYDYAKKKGKTILAFVIEDIDKLPHNKVDKRLKNLIAFQEKVKNGGDNVEFWKDSNSLVSAVKSSLGLAINRKTTGGWIKLDNDIDDDQANVINEWGVQRIFKTRAEKNNESDPLLESHNIKYLDGVAFGLRSFRSIRRNDVIANLNNGLRMRLLVMNPDSDFAEQRALEENEDADAISSSIRELIIWVKGIQADTTAGSIEIKVYDAMTLDFYWRIDDVVYVGPYLYGVPSQQTLTLKYSHPGKGFDLYTQYFEDLWNNSTLCHSPL